MTTRALRLVALLIPIAMAAAWLHVFAPTRAWVGAVHVAVPVALAAVAIATAIAVWRRHATWQRALAIGLLASQIAIVGLRIAGVHLIDLEIYRDVRLATAIVVGDALAVYGMVRLRIWGRWLGVALGAVGAVSGGLNVINFWPVTRAVDPRYVAWSMEMLLTMWVLLVLTLGATLVVVNLISPEVRAQFVARATDSTWLSRDRRIAWLRATIVTAFIAAPMLLVYAWSQPIVRPTGATAVALAAVLAIGALLAVRGKLIGAIVLVIAGLGLVAQTVLTALSAPPSERWVTGFYGVFWLPAAVVAIACGAQLAGPTWRLIRHGASR